MKDRQIVAGNIMKVALSCDQAVVDVVSGPTFLTDPERIAGKFFKNATVSRSICSIII